MCVFQSAFVCFCDWGAEGGQDDYIVWLFLEDVLDAFLDEAGHVGDLYPLWRLVLTMICDEGLLFRLLQCYGR